MKLLITYREIIEHTHRQIYSTTIKSVHGFHIFFWNSQNSNNAQFLNSCEKKSWSRVRIEIKSEIEYY